MFVIIIQARMGSTRLPGKVMKKLLDKEIFKWSYDRCCKSKAEKVFIATSLNSENDILEKKCKEYGINCFRGSENDVLDRFYQVIKNYNINDYDLKIIRVTSDCPFVDSNIINEMIEYFENNECDYIINHNEEGIIPEGSGIEIIKFSSLKYLWENEKDQSFREHVTGLLGKTNKYNDQIKKGKYIYKPDIDDFEKHKNLKISIDTLEDYELSVHIVEHFKNYDFSYEELLQYLTLK